MTSAGVQRVSRRFPHRRAAAVCRDVAHAHVVRHIMDSGVAASPLTGAERASSACENPLTRRVAANKASSSPPPSSSKLQLRHHDCDKL